MRSYRAQKAALTRAKNSGDPRKVVAEVAKFYNEFDAANMPLPDDWHRWNVAKRDAEFELRRRSWGEKPRERW